MLYYRVLYLRYFILNIRPYIKIFALRLKYIWMVCSKKKYSPIKIRTTTLQFLQQFSGFNFSDFFIIFFYLWINFQIQFTCCVNGRAIFLSSRRLWTALGQTSREYASVDVICLSNERKQIRWTRELVKAHEIWQSNEREAEVGPLSTWLRCSRVLVKSGL